MIPVRTYRCNRTTRHPERRLLYGNDGVRAAVSDKRVQRAPAAGRPSRLAPAQRPLARRVVAAAVQV